jgi:hypothetical protein
LVYTERASIPEALKINKTRKSHTQETIITESNNKMAPGIISPVPGTPLSPLYNNGFGSRQVSSASAMFESDNISQNGMSRSVRRESGIPRKLNGGNSQITSVVNSWYTRSGNELGAGAFSRLSHNHTHLSIIEWIRQQRMSHLPAEGSSYDKVLGWAQLFVERLHSFELNIHHFAGDSHLATQLSYGFCDLLLQVN